MNQNEFCIKKGEWGLVIIGFPVKFDYIENEGHILMNEETAKQLALVILEETK